MLGLASDTVERAYASPAAPTETVAGVSLPSNEAALQRLGEAIADDGKKTTFRTHSRVDNDTEAGYMHHGGVLPLVLRQLLAKA